MCEEASGLNNLIPTTQPLQVESSPGDSPGSIYQLPPFSPEAMRRLLQSDTDTLIMVTMTWVTSAHGLLGSYDSQLPTPESNLP